uniref:Uncharacterized protein n=1 Tax=Oryza nivara TaxID=4536 RepID=A0A0E0J347_ORYNI
MTIPPRRGEVFPNGLDDGVRAPSNGAPAFSSNGMAMSVRKVAGPSKMIEDRDECEGVAGRWSLSETSSHNSDHNGGIFRAWRRCDDAGTTAGFDGVALGGQCYQQLDRTASVWASPIRRTARQLRLGEVQASWKNLMTIPPRRGEVFPNGLDDGVRAPSNGAPAFSSNGMAMSVRKVAGPSKMIEDRDECEGVAGRWSLSETSSHNSDHNGGIFRAWRRCDDAGTTAGFDGVALGGQCYQQLDRTASVWASPIRWTR